MMSTMRVGKMDDSQLAGEYGVRAALNVQRLQLAAEAGREVEVRMLVAHVWAEVMLAAHYGRRALGTWLQDQ